MTKNERINSVLTRIFYQTVTKAPSLMESLPDNAHVVMQIEGNDTFNRWAKEIALKHPLEKGRRVVYAIFKLGPELPSQHVTPQQIATASVEHLELQPVT